MEKNMTNIDSLKDSIDAYEDSLDDNLTSMDINITDMDISITGMDINMTKMEGNATVAANITTELIHLYQVPPTVTALLTFFYLAISLCAAVGNSLVIYVVVVAPRMRTVTNFYIANLAFADVTIALFAMPFQVHQTTTFTAAFLYT